jgi:hypothetical protein
MASFRLVAICNAHGAFERGDGQFRAIVAFDERVLDSQSDFLEIMLSGDRDDVLGIEIPRTFMLQVHQKLPAPRMRQAVPDFRDFLDQVFTAHFSCFHSVVILFFVEVELTVRGTDYLFYR